MRQLVEPPAQLLLDVLHRLVERRPRRDVVAVGVDLDPLQRPRRLARQRIKLGNLVDLIAEERDLPRPVLLVHRPDIERISLHPKGPPPKRLIIPLVLQRHEIRRHLPGVSGLALSQLERHRGISLNRPNAVNARHRGDNDHIIPLQNRPRGRVAHSINRFVDGALFLDVGVGPGDVSLGHIVVVVAHEILDGVVGEKALELAIELRCQRLVVREDQRGSLHCLDHLRHRERLARAGDAEKDLVELLVLYTLNEIGDRLRLVARRLVVRRDAEFPAPLELVPVALRPVRRPDIGGLRQRDRRHLLRLECGLRTFGDAGAAFMYRRRGRGRRLGRLASGP